MEIEFTLIAMQDLDYFKKSGNKTILKKIGALLESIQESPYVGIGKPEALQYEQSGNWSRRISQEH